MGKVIKDMVLVQITMEFISIMSIGAAKPVFKVTEMQVDYFRRLEIPVV